MTKAIVVALASFFFAAVAVLSYRELVTDEDGLGIQQRFWCREYLGSVRSESERSRLVTWADAAIFSREFGKGSFQLGHFAGPRKASHTLKTQAGDFRLPDWMPAHYEIRVLGKSGSEFSSIFITGGKFRGVVVVRQDWDQVLDGQYLKPNAVLVRRGRVGLVCY